MSFSLRRKSDQAVIVSHGIVADRFWPRLRGWIGKKSAKDGEGIYFPDCNSIHMWMMAIPIDVIFLRKIESHGEFEIVKTIANLRPWRFVPVFSSSASETIELPSGTIERFGLRSGEVLCIAS